MLIVKLDQDQKEANRKNDTYDSAYALFEGLTLNAFKSGIFPLKKEKDVLWT